MAARKDVGRQYSLYATLRMGVADIANDGAVTLPPGALLLSGAALVVTAFDGTTATLTVTDGTTTFINAADVKSTGNTAFSNAPKFYPSGGTLQFNLAQTGTTTVGDVIGHAVYIVPVTRQNENQTG